jgi:F0F1-type ATP synthase assembly protein I
MDRWSEWYDSLPQHTKELLKKQPLWHDRDLIKAAVVGAVIGFILGLTI